MARGVGNKPIKASSSLKSSIPIPLPHDGPIYHGLKSNQVTGVASSFSFPLALQLLQSSEPVSPTAKFVETLKDASTTKQQLQLLQAYRSKLLDCYKHEEPVSLDELTGLHRLLLEWSFSNETPMPLRRAIHSNLSTFQDIPVNTILREVLVSFWKQSECWENVLESLQLAMYYGLSATMLQEHFIADVCSFLYDQKVYSYLQTPESTQTFISDGLSISEILKILLSSATDEIPHLAEFRQFLVQLLGCSTMPTDGFNILGISYARLLLLATMDPATKAIQSIQELDATSLGLSALARLAIVQGIAATLDQTDLTKEVDGVTPITSCWRYSLIASRVATDPMVRLGALKGLSTLLSRYKSSQMPLDQTLVNETLEVTLQAWENPPMRKLGTAIPGLFKSLVELLDKDQLGLLRDQILKQPVHRKGRYLGLEIILPKVGAQSLHAESLLPGIGDSGHNAGVISDLWTKILGPGGEEVAPPEPAFATWISHWVPSLARALMTPELSRRKQVAAFCLPRIVALMKGLESLRPLASLALGSLLLEINQTLVDSYKDIEEHALWAKLEVARHVTINKVMTPELCQTIASCVPEDTLRLALTHSQAPLRLVAFQALEPVVTSYGQTVEKEAEFWQFAFPYAVKTTESKDYTSTMLQCLSAFLDRLSAAEADESKAQEEADIPVMPKLYSFVVRFLINEVILKKGAYPGTVADKEGFSVALLECILAFIAQDQSYSSDNCVAKHGIIFNRRRRPVEMSTMTEILMAVLDVEVLAVLFALLHSIWDNTRAVAFLSLSKLVVAGEAHGLQLPTEYNSEESRHCMQRRAVYLASSPRQREADTGARMLAFLYISLPSPKERAAYLTSLVDLLENRLLSMKAKLSVILSAPSADYPSGDKHEDGGNLPLAHGIIHSIRLAIEHNRLLRKHQMCLDVDTDDTLYRRMTAIFCQAMQVSLAVVADVRKGEVIEGMDEDNILGQDGVPPKKRKTGSTPLNTGAIFNTSAIGANGIFSSVNAAEQNEAERRFAVQRVVVGSWLLTKETCAAVAVTITAEGFKAPFSLVEQVGALLISTLTSLKHAGAAFAAHNALQEIATSCLSKDSESSLSKLPPVWTDRLLEEISGSDKVRDSTLRRSTGYALGFLSIMRSETSSKFGSSTLCSRILSRILRQSLPSEKQMNSELERLDLAEKDAQGPLFTYFSSEAGTGGFVPDDKYEAKSRVHALNVLRLIILDAPLASEVAPIVGDAIISAILGYDDTTWAVRNSATMVFAAAMLRTIDPDKNASNTDRTSSKAITVTELFRRYPSVSSFLLSVMRAGISESMKSHDRSDSNSQAFPILLLLSRVQPVVGSGMIAAERTELFIPIIIECLKSRDHSIRSAAARALANLCSGDQIDCSSALVLLKGRTEVLSNTLTKKSQTNWNEIHGSLLAIECLIRSSDLAKKIFRELKADRTMLAITDWMSSSPRFPPCCVATAIEILVYFSIEIDNLELQAETRICCQHILSWLGSTKDSVGAAKLGAAAASGQCALLLPSVWNTRAHNSGFQQLLSELSNLLENDSIDARLAATKSFKKEIYHYLDQLLSSDDNDRSPVHFRRQTLVSIARMLLLTLRTEMDRDVSSPSSLLGTHPPTVRRLSRCLLECSQAHKALTGGDTGDFLTGLGEQEGALWNVSLHITERESFTEEEGLESNGETLLSANAAELMAIEIASEIQRSTEKSGDDATFLKRVSTFVKVIARLNDPHSSWRSRYSAALAVEASSLLTSRMENQGADLWRKQLLVEILRMLQDSDSDVRSAAGQVASQMFSSASDFQASLTQLPQLILEATYPKVRNIAPADDEHDFMNTLINTILLNCQGAIASIALLQSEIRHSNDTSDSSSSLLNLSTSRKIFEEEDPNPFEERLLANQLATQTLLQMNVTLSNGPLQGQILDLCSSCLGSIRNNLKTKEIVYDLTRFPSVFPAIHSLIIGSAVMLYLGASDASGVRQAAKEVLEITHGNKLPIQPEILRSLAALVDAKEGCNATRTTIRECCFLL